MLASVWIVAKWLMLQIIMMISIFHITKKLSFRSFALVLQLFGYYYKKSRLAFAIWQKFWNVSKNCWKARREKIFDFFFFCVSTQTKFSFFDQVKTFLLNYSKWWWTDISKGIRLISQKYRKTTFNFLFS